jgi:hypothetical protein
MNFSKTMRWCALVAVWTAACGGDELASDGSGKELPCDVERIIGVHCQGCHSDPTQFGAPVPLVTADDFQAQAPGDSQRVYELVLDHVRGKTDLMPPPPNSPLSDDEIDTLAKWIEKGAPGSEGECTDGDAGVTPEGIYTGLTQPPADCDDFYEFHAHNTADEKDETPYELAKSSPQSNTYMCFYFKPPYGDAESTALWAHSLIDNSKILHHWILFGTDNATEEPGTIKGCTPNVPGAYYITGWAPGGKDFELPSNVALELPSGPSAGLILQIHYVSPDGKATKDHTGVRICTAKKGSRPHLAAVHYTGSEGICLPPQEQHTVSGQCVPRQDMGDIHLVGVSPHMHKLGTHLKVTLLRKNGDQEILYDAPFAFSSQVYLPFPIEKYVMHPGDTLQTDCTYDNTTDEQVHFGERTQDEMCYGFVTAWPAGALTTSGVVSTLSGVVEGLNRCVDPLSILQSCGGASDAQFGN